MVKAVSQGSIPKLKLSSVLKKRGTLLKDNNHGPEINS